MEIFYKLILFVYSVNLVLFGIMYTVSSYSGKWHTHFNLYATKIAKKVYEKKGIIVDARNICSTLKALTFLFYLTPINIIMMPSSIWKAIKKNRAKLNNKNTS